MKKNYCMPVARLVDTGVGSGNGVSETFIKAIENNSRGGGSMVSPSGREQPSCFCVEIDGEPNTTGTARCCQPRGSRCASNTGRGLACVASDF